jgi:hypothetical protein
MLFTSCLLPPTHKQDAFYFKIRLKKALKVVGNEKGGGLGGWLLFEDGF